MRLGLCKEDLFALLLHCEHFHHLMDVATVEVAEELYFMPHEVMHRHEGGILGSTKPADQLVADIKEPGDCLKVITDAFVKVHHNMVCNGGALLGQTYILKTLTHQNKQCWTIVLLSIQKSSQKLWSMNERKYSDPNCA
jgi:hypothetical protein